MKHMLFESLEDGKTCVSIEEDGVRTSLISPERFDEDSRNTSNIYLGVISRIEPSLNACFINYGEDHHGFLPLHEVASFYFQKGNKLHISQIGDAVKIGQELIVQVQQVDDVQGPSLTTYVMLPGRYLVLLPRHDARRQAHIPELAQHALQKRLAVPPDIFLTVRDGAINCTIDNAQFDLGYLRQLWSAIEGAARCSPAPFLIYQDDSIIIRAIRDYFHDDIEEIIVDSKDIYEQLTQYMQHVMPAMAHRVKPGKAWHVTGISTPEEMSPNAGKTLLSRLRNLFAR